MHALEMIQKRNSITHADAITVGRRLITRNSVTGNSVKNVFTRFFFLMANVFYATSLLLGFYALTVHAYTLSTNIKNALNGLGVAGASW